MIQEYKNIRCLNFDYEDDEYGDDEYGDADNYGFGWGSNRDSDEDND